MGTLVGVHPTIPWLKGFPIREFPLVAVVEIPSEQRFHQTLERHSCLKPGWLIGILIMAYYNPY